MISISTTSASNYNLILNEQLLSDAETQTARISRSKTLDGGCVIINNGVQDADRTFNYSVRTSKENINKIYYLFQNETLVSISNETGFFHAAFEQFQNDSGILGMTFLVKESI